MNEDATFRLTPLDVRRYEFGTSLRGYDKTRVDEFREQVAAELERLTRANLDIEARARQCHEQLKSFRERDKALNDALVSAQQLRSEIREQADREAQLARREAQMEVDRLLEGARSELRRYEDELASLDRMRRSHLAQLRAMAERQLSEIVAAEGAIPSGGDRSPFAEIVDDGAGTTPRATVPTPAWLRKVDDA